MGAREEIQRGIDVNVIKRSVNAGKVRRRSKGKSEKKGTLPGIEK